MTVPHRRLLRAWGLVLAVVFILAVVLLSARWRKAGSDHKAFIALMIEGRNAFENADVEKAIAAFEKAVSRAPTDRDAHLNLANAYLLGGRSEQAIAECEQVLRLSTNSAAALYIIGCANLRLGNSEAALKALQQSQFIDPTVSAVSFHIGRAHQALGHWEDAAGSFAETIRLEPEHAAAHYALSQMLIRLNQPEAAQGEIARHKEIGAARGNLPNEPTYFEKCKYTVAQLPHVKPEQPNEHGIKVTFADATEKFFGAGAPLYRGPIGIVDLPNDTPNSLVVLERAGVRVLANRGDRFEPLGEALAVSGETAGGRCLVGDLNNDGFDDIVILSQEGAKVFKLGKEGTLSDVTVTSGLGEVRATDGILADIDLTAKLGLITFGEDGIATFRNQGNIVFRSVNRPLGIPEPQSKTPDIVFDDWNGDDLPDLFIARDDQPVQLALNQHGGPFRLAELGVERLQPSSKPDAQSGTARQSEPWPTGKTVAVGDLNCDLRNDLVVANAAGLEVVFADVQKHLRIAVNGLASARLTLLDYDNDGWLDILAVRPALRIWRNLGDAGFREVTADLGLDKTFGGQVDAVSAADFDTDGDTDLIITASNGSVRFLRNDGSNANLQIKVRVIGKRSNASALGTRLELIAGGWRTTRTINRLPVEIGVGRHATLEALSLHSTDLVMNLGAIDVDPKTRIYIPELELPTGSCPYLYVWDGQRHRFVSDILGAAPAGLRISEDRFVEADTEELVRVGDERSVQPREGNIVLQITDELRELLFLDQARLVAADHPVDIEVHPTSKLRPGKPFPPHELVPLGLPRALRSATRSDGLDVTKALTEIDGDMASPVTLRAPQLRGLAEPFSLTLDFGPLPVDRPLVLALTGWLRFGGGMANVAASHDPGLPFPFPHLEVEIDDGRWQPVDVVAGAPAGKTKSIVIDLSRKLPANARRLRWNSAFEIHWDRIALFEQADPSTMRVTALDPDSAHLHWHGQGEHEKVPWFLPVTPIYDKLRARAPWLVTLAGWCTRYGDVKELLTQRDDALVILNCGDEVTLSFDASRLPEKPPAWRRDFFLFSSGWDKDADYHVEAGRQVEPLPFHGMDDQRYGRELQPREQSGEWIKKYNTRWVGPLTLVSEAPAANRPAAPGAR